MTLSGSRRNELVTLCTGSFGSHLVLPEGGGKRVLFGSQCPQWTRLMDCFQNALTRGARAGPGKVRGTGRACPLATTDIVNFKFFALGVSPTRHDGVT